MTFYNRKSKKYPKNGLLYYRLNGNRFSTGLEDTPKNRKKIQNYLKDDEFLLKHTVKKDKHFFNDLIIKALAEKEKDVKHNSYDCYESCSNIYTLPFFKDIYVEDISPLLMKKYFNLFDNRSSLNSSLVIVNLAFENAILQNFITHNPTKDITKPKFETDYKPNPFNLEEISLILNDDNFYRNMFCIAFYTGMRFGEIIALKWSDIDFVNNKISISRRRYNGIEQKAKTKASNAVIDLPYEAKEYFISQRLRTGLKDYVFYSIKGKLINNTSTISYYFNNLLNKLNIKKRGIHQIRHTFASLKLSYGERIEWVSYMLRHENITITQNIYYQWIPQKEEKRIIINLIDTKKAQ